MRYLITLLIIALFGCNNCPCINSDVRLNFTGFDTTEVRGVILEKFEKGSRFSKKLDSLFFVEGDYRSKFKNDTISFPIRTGDFGLTAQFDWKISLAGSVKQFLVADITSEQIRSSCAGKVQCVNPITFATINNKPYYFNTPYQIFLEK